MLNFLNKPNEDPDKTIICFYKAILLLGEANSDFVNPEHINEEISYINNGLLDKRYINLIFFYLIMIDVLGNLLLVM